MRPAFSQLRSASAPRPGRGLNILFLCLVICSALPNASSQTANAGQRFAPESLSLTTDAVSPRRFVAVHGRRALVDGYADSGLEVWAYPVQLIQNYRIGFRSQGMTSEIPGATILRRIVYRPDEIVRIYIGPNFLVREKLFVPLNKPGATLTYTVESRDPVDIVVHFVPVLNLMWPAGIGGQDVTWDPASSGYVLSEQMHRFSAVVGSTAIVAHDEILNRADSSSAQGSLAFTIRPGGSSSSRTATIVIASGDVNTASLNTLVKTLTDTGSELEKEAASHYADLRSSIVQIETPDSTLNQDLAWADVALDQAWVCNPYLGCGLVAGYGPSRGARRPQYAWFFAGDAMVAVRALLSAGEYARAREALEFIAKYQDPKTGMIWHEMSQSAGLIDWTGKYPYMFVHVDISFQYLNTIAAYIAASGDKKFLQDHWQSVSAAYRYCQSLIDPRDGLPRIPPGKEGGDEQDRMSNELTLSASWIEASKSFADMATWMSDATQAAQAMQAGEKARKSAATRYWDEQEKFWIDGYSPSGKKIVNRSSNGNVVITQHLFSKPQQQSLLDQLASPSFQTDWGTRSTAMNSSVFNPDSYAKGSVWAVGTAEMAMAFWAGHRPSTAFSIWGGLIPWSSLDSLGHMDEVLAGDYYHEQTESVPEQTWSSALFFQTAVQGLLGLRVNALQNQLDFSPHLPADWNAVTVRNIQLPQSKITLAWARTNDGSELEIVNNGSSVHFVYSPEIPLDSKLSGAILNGKPIHARLEEHSQDTHATVDVDLPHGTSHLSLAYSGGVSLILPLAHPLLGDSSRAMKVIGVKMRGTSYIVDAQVDSASASSFQLRSDRKVLAVHDAIWKALSSDTYALTITPTSSSDHLHSYSAVEIVVDLASLH
jgi:glycogen debranching enzyme